MSKAVLVHLGVFGARDRRRHAGPSKADGTHPVPRKETRTDQPAQAWMATASPSMRVTDSIVLIRPLRRSISDITGAGASRSGLASHTPSAMASIWLRTTVSGVRKLVNHVRHQPLTKPFLPAKERPTSTPRVRSIHLPNAGRLCGLEVVLPATLCAPLPWQQGGLIAPPPYTPSHRPPGSSPRSRQAVRSDGKRTPVRWP